MSTSPVGPNSYIRRNLPPLIVGFAAVIAIVGGLIVAIDRIRDDDGDAGVAASDTASEVSDSASPLDDDLTELLGSLFGGGRATLGITVSEVDDALRVVTVLPGSAAAAAGIEVGDEIRELNGDRVHTAEELRDALAAVDVGHEYDIEIRRDGDDQTLTARRDDLAGAAFTALLERFFEQGFNLESFGLGDFDLESFDFDAPRGQFQFGSGGDRFSESRLRPTLGVSVVQTNAGLLVVGVERGSVAADAGLQQDDIIVAVDGARVSTIEGLRAALPLASLGADGRSSIVPVVELLVRRGDQELRLEARFSLGPRLQRLPEALALPLATPTPDLMTQRLLEELGELRAYLQSEDLFEVLNERFEERLKDFLDEVTEAAAGQPDSPAEVDSPDFMGLNVFRGTVEILTDDQITLGGSLGAISFSLSDETVFVGGTPRVGRVSSVGATGDLEAILVLTTN